jgi:hypothetical protein
MLPEHGRIAGMAKAEKALNDLTDAAFHLGIAHKTTDLLVSLWNAFHPGGPPPYVFHKPPIHGGHEARTPTTPNPTTWRGKRCNLERLDSPEGRAALQDVLLGRCSQRQAALKLGVHPSTFGDALRRLRQERQSANDPAEIAQAFSLTSP